MLTTRQLAWLHAFQSDLALKRDWVAVGHVQSLIDHIAGEQGLLPDDGLASGPELALH